MGARSARLAGPVGSSAVNVLDTLYTCPAGKVALIKSIRIVNNTGAVKDTVVGIGDPFYGYNRFLRVPVAASGTYVDSDTDPVVLHAGQVIQARVIQAGAVAGDVTYVISGAELIA